MIRMTNVQIFGLKNSQSTRAADRFFKERGVTINFVDLSKKPMAPREIRRFIDRFGLGELVDRGGKSYVEAGLGYFKLSDGELIAKIEGDPTLLRLPLVRCGDQLSVGRDEPGWKEMLRSGK
jgi:arsenate reductase-like glutaredoxin family protein